MKNWLVLILSIMVVGGCATTYSNQEILVEERMTEELAKWDHMVIKNYRKKTFKS